MVLACSVAGADVGIQDVLLDDGTTAPIIRVARAGGVVLLGVYSLHRALVRQLMTARSFL
jgi:hypothetical protein